jgi:hypothetical protein
MHFKDMTHPTSKSKKNIQTPRLMEIISENNHGPRPALYPKGWANRRSSMIPEVLKIYFKSIRLRDPLSEN